VKRVLSLIICFTMVLTSYLPSFADAKANFSDSYGTLEEQIIKSYTEMDSDQEMKRKLDYSKDNF